MECQMKAALGGSVGTLPWNVASGGVKVCKGCERTRLASMGRQCRGHVQVCIVVQAIQT